MRFIYFALLISFFSVSSCASKKDSISIKVASYNVRNARGMDNNTDFDRVANVITEIDADAIAIQELDSATNRSNGLVILDELAQRTNMYSSFNGSIDYQGGKYGIGILTKNKPLKQEAIPLPGKEEKRSVLLIELEDFVLCCTHLSLTKEDRLSSFELIKDLTEKYNKKPIILAGDLNAKPNDEEILKLSEDWIFLNDTIIKTFPSPEPKVTIDYILLKADQTLEYEITQREVVSEPMASDHRPLWVNLKIRNRKHQK